MPRALASKQTPLQRDQLLGDGLHTGLRLENVTGLAFPERVVLDVDHGRRITAMQRGPRRKRLPATTGQSPRPIFLNAAPHRPNR